MDIYVGNLAPEITKEDLRKVFESFGRVEIVSIIEDKFSGKSKGFGFVEMSNKTEAQAAITGMNGKKLKGRTLKVRNVHPRSGDRRKNSGGRRSL